MQDYKYSSSNLGKNSYEETLDRITKNKLDKVEYIGELVLKLQKLYSKSLIDETFFNKSLELLNNEREEVCLNNIKEEREFYLDIIDKSQNFKELEQINDLILNKLEYCIENKSLIVGKLNNKFTEVFEKMKFSPGFDDEGDLCNFISRSDILINKENKKNAIIYMDKRSKSKEYSTNIKNLLGEEKEKYFETEKQGIIMKLMETRSFSDLKNIGDRIVNNLVDERSEDFFKEKFEKSFKRIFKQSYLYSISKDLQNYNIALDLDSVYIGSGKIIFNNKKYTLEKIREISDISGEIRFDEGELSSLRYIIKNTDKFFLDNFIKNQLSSLIKLPIVTDSVKNKVEYINKGVTKIINSDNSRFFRGPLILKSEFKFEDRLKKCCASYKQNLSKKDVIFIFDNTIFKTGEKGFIFTYDKIYIKNEDEECRIIDIDDIDDIKLDKNNNDIIYFDDQPCNCEIISSKYREKFNDILILITYLIQNIRDNSKNNDEVIDQVLSIVSN